MTNFFKLYLISFPTLLIVDAFWLGVIAPKFYKSHIGFLMSETPNLVAALMFYLLYIVGLIVFVIQPGW